MSRGTKWTEDDLRRIEAKRPAAKKPPKPVDTPPTGVPFLDDLQAAGLPLPIGEFRFHPTRRWRFDWAFTEMKIAVEQEGGIWTQGRHTRGSGFKGDMEKYNSATKLGWRVFRFTPEEMSNGVAVAFLVEVFARK